MTQFVPRTGPVDAVQFTDVASLPPGVQAVEAQWRHWGPAVTRYTLGPNGAELHLTDWIVSYPDGYQEVLPDREFHARFAPAS